MKYDVFLIVWCILESYIESDRVCPPELRACCRAGNFLHGDGSDVLGGTRGQQDLGGFCNYWALQTNNGNFMMLWRSMYKLIAKANLALEGLKIVGDVNPETAKYYEA